MLSVAEYRRLVLSNVEPLPAETVDLDHALGRALAEGVASATAIPPFDNSAMDGYAVLSGDLRGASEEAPVGLRVVADLPAGTGLRPQLERGTAARIMTGAPIPPGADAVVPIERVLVEQDRIRISTPAEPGAHIRRAGDDVHAGAAVLAAGTVLGPRHLAAAASSGAARLRVGGRPRVGVVSTGSELVPPGEELTRGRIPDSNSYLLAAAVGECGALPHRIGIVADDPRLLEAALDEHAGTVDAFVLSGGVSVGAFDVVKAVLAPRGGRFESVRMQPGKPQGFGRWSNGVPIFALPGNPVSAAVSFEAFVRPALLRMQGCAELERPIARAAVIEGWNSPPGRRQYLPITVGRGHDTAYPGLSVRPASRGGSASHLVAGLAGADGLAVVDEDVTRVEAGDVVDVLLWRR
ncbi:MAG: molybdopterin molybdenumtransferase MoeA [Naasia sp.]|uniref:molybdopterin molybdotransferase MoeA n=1 Tax=Naasia sp. TaxID=2546198 RepID=UPI00260F1472|nr:gephyrin-like molybdotransferase Glp [Naasia sp.]MCU1571447.1 molybdopterin molybdenumtransferase MoeA [Naasia sp.]